MGNFCKYCGKPLVNGACDCATAQAQNAGSVQDTAQAYTGNIQNMGQQTPVQPQQGYTNPQQNFQYQQPQGGQAPYVQHQPSMQSQMVKQEALAAKNLFISALKNPVAILEHISATKKNTSALILGAIHLLLLFLCTTINIPMLGEYMETGDKAKVGIVLLLIAGVPVAVSALVAMFTGKKYNPNLTYVDSLAVFSIATVPGTVMFLASFLVGLVSPLFAVILLIACYLAWVLLSVEAMNTVSKAGKDTNYWIILAVHVVIFILVILIGKEVAVDALKELSYGSLLNF